MNQISNRKGIPEAFKRLPWALLPFGSRILPKIRASGVERCALVPKRRVDSTLSGNWRERVGGRKCWTRAAMDRR
jgi:hypothetical protein